jgi:amidase
MARCVADAAALLAALAGVDPDDPATAAGAGKAADYLQALDPRALQGKRLGVAREFFGRNDQVNALAARELALLAAQGAELVDVTIPNNGKYDDSELEVLLYEFGPGLRAYLEAYAPGAPVRSLADVIAFNERYAARELRYFGQEHLIAAAAKGSLQDQAYRDALANDRRYAAAEGIDQVLREHRLDALVAPTGGPAWLTDFIHGDHYGASFSSPAAVAGYPHVTVPAGYVRGLPVGLSFVGPAWSEAALIGMAYAYEQATRHRRAPTFAASIKLACGGRGRRPPGGAAPPRRR